MTAPMVRLSIRSLFLWVVMAIVTITLVISSGLSIYSQVNAYEEEIINHVETLTELVASNAEMYIEDGDEFATTTKLNSLNVAPIVLNVNVYRFATDPDTRFTLFASYNKPGQALARPEELDSEYTRLRGNYIEVVRKVRGNTNLNEVLGYIFLRASAEGLQEQIGSTILINLTVMLLMMLVSFLLALRLQRVITDPIEDLADFLQRISRQRDYGARSRSSNVRELAILSEAVNVMLMRIQEYVQKQQKAEEQHRKLNASLEDMVSQRTVALKDANQELIQTLEKLHQFQRQIVQNEKMASLGDMVAGVAHEVNTPIGLGVTASTMMLDRLANIQKEFESKTLKASTMSKFLAESQENLNIIYRNLNRAAELISSFKQVAVDQSSENSRSFCFAQLVNEILLSLRPRLKKVGHNINIEVDPTLTVESKAGPINQILINLIMNSIIHGFEGIDDGNIDICAELMAGNKLKIVYRDDGKGIPPDIRKRIFDPFVTTKRGQGGSGLGMHLVYNLVTQALNGSISLTSEEGHGVEFIIVFPVAGANSA
ncbi:ATP-binding protein [Alteromonas sp. ASW11-19]|uniref:histidine kinase n=1 Tax=Alteromonas salexigens TaxID=2982530 RepID=A0ABT2VMX7_9ALTE|nr:ATP-binding protein [Alteromonas salexigens]MCU7554673.1 ATP-binding protein [Alteromonas salexigens]